MENNFKVLDLFPTPLVVINLPQSFSTLTSFFNNQEITSPPFESPFGGISKNSYILDEVECLGLKNFILNKVLLFGNNILSYDYSSYKITQSWITIKYPNQSHHIHSHSNSIISGVLYYGNFLSDTPPILFHKHSNSFYNTNIIENAPPQGNLNLYSSPSFIIYPKPGNLILFPSWLPHSVPENKTNIPRTSLSFNILPKRGLGAEKSLNELKFN